MPRHARVRSGHLKSVRLLVVLGHTGCGAVNAAVEAFLSPDTYLAIAANPPLRSIVDSLLPRLEYVQGSAKGPAGAVFTAGENRVGSMELRWDIGTVPPGVQGAVSFEAKVR